MVQSLITIVKQTKVVLSVPTNFVVRRFSTLLLLTVAWSSTEGAIG